MRLRRLLGSLRGRLVLAYIVAAVVVALLGGWIFSVQLRAGLSRSLDSALDSRAAPLVEVLRARADPDLPEPTLPGHTSESLTAVLRPNGAVASESGGVVLPIATQQLAKAHSGIRRFTQLIGDARFRILLIPVARTDGTWIVVLGADQEVAKRATDTVDAGLVLAGGLLLVLAAFGAWLLSGAALRPVESMRAEAGRLDGGDTGDRLREHGIPSELSRLAHTFNGLLDQLHESSSRQRVFVADASHELRTPLSILRTELELAEKPQRSKAELQGAITHAREEVDRLSQLAEDLLFLARADSEQALVELEDLDLASVVAEAIRAHAAEGKKREVVLRVEGPEHVHILGDRTALRRALDNLIVNALRHTPEHATITVSLEQGPEATIVSVRDTGEGFDDAFLPHCFERFRRADSSRSSDLGGTGLGLAIVAEIAVAHGGSAHAANAPGGGGVVSLKLPRIICPPRSA